MAMDWSSRAFATQLGLFGLSGVFAVLGVAVFRTLVLDSGRASDAAIWWIASCTLWAVAGAFAAGGLVLLGVRHALREQARLE